VATPAWQRKEGQNPAGGLNAKGRASYKAQTGGTLKAPVKGRPSSPEEMRRKGSFLSRMGGSPGPMKDEKGRPTRKALALKAWWCVVAGAGTVDGETSSRAVRPSQSGTR